MMQTSKELFGKLTKIIKKITEQVSEDTNLSWSSSQRILTDLQIKQSARRERSKVWTTGEGLLRQENAPAHTVLSEKKNNTVLVPYPLIMLLTKFFDTHKEKYETTRIR